MRSMAYVIGEGTDSPSTNFREKFALAQHAYAVGEGMDSPRTSNMEQFVQPQTARRVSIMVDTRESRHEQLTSS